MIVLLPDENTTFLQLLKDLQHNPFSKILNSLYQRTVNLYLPRFTVNYSTKLSSALKKVWVYRQYLWSWNVIQQQHSFAHFKCIFYIQCCAWVIIFIIDYVFRLDWHQYLIAMQIYHQYLIQQNRYLWRM